MSEDFKYIDFWNNRYLAGGNSGAGSYGANAKFKADFLNKFIKKHGIKSVLEIGSGDGANLALYEIENYLGLDVSEEAVRMCKEKFKGDKTKNFEIADGLPRLWSIDEKFKPKTTADLVICFDVLYHIFPREEWEKTIKYCIDS